MFGQTSSSGSALPQSDADERDDNEALDEGSVRVHLNFWQHPMVQNLLPLATSLTFHLSLVVVALLLYGGTQIITRSVLREQVIIPEAAMVEGAPVGGLPNPGLGNDPNLSAAQNVDPRITVADGWADKRSESLAQTLMGGGAADATDSVIGLGPKSGLVGTGGQGAGGSGGDGGPMAPFGPPGGGMGLGPRAPFGGISGNARKVVYICDASGSMMSIFWRVREELKKSLDVLIPIQAFNVIFFSDVDVTPLSKTSLVMATPDNKLKALELSNKMSAAGTTDPLPAIRLAFEQKPELMYVLTDGFDQVVSFDAVINEFRKLNADKKVKVNTILIQSSANAELERVLQTIADENGGRCVIKSRQDF
jgi:hypothetical protein